MDFATIDLTFAIDMFLLLLIGIGPKIALVPYLEITKGMDGATKRRIVQKMLITATITAIILLIFGELLTGLLHFSPGALSIASGIILLILAVPMVLRSPDFEAKSTALAGKDPMQLATFPLAVPYLLNPVGIVVLITASAESTSFGVIAVIIGVLAAVIVLDIIVFRWANRVSEHLDENRMLVIEKVFGFLLAALAVQLILNGLADLGVIHLIGH